MKRIVLAIFLGAIFISPIRPTLAQQPKTPADLHKLAADYYNWRNQNYPVASSDAGLHTWDNKLTDYSLSRTAGAATARQGSARQSTTRCRPRSGARTIASTGCCFVLNSTA